MTNKKKNTWIEYYNAQGTFGIKNSLLIKSAGLIKKSKKPLVAIDLGCGRGDDTMYLLKKCFSVSAYDSQKYDIKYMRENIPIKYCNNLKSKVIKYELLRQKDLKPYSLLNASKSLYFCDPQQFDRLWKLITKNLIPGGIFCGHFLGVKDDWSKYQGITALTKKKLTQLFKDFRIIHFHENEDDTGTITGQEKHWHTYTVIARKK